MFAVEHGKVAPVSAGVVQADNFGSDPLGFFFGRAEFNHANFFTFAIFSGQRFRRQQRRFFIVLNDFAGDAEDALGGAVILG